MDVDRTESHLYYQGTWMNENNSFRPPRPTVKLSLPVVAVVAAHSPFSHQLPLMCCSQSPTRFSPTPTAISITLPPSFPCLHPPLSLSLSSYLIMSSNSQSIILNNIKMPEHPFLFRKAKKRVTYFYFYTLLFQEISKISVNNLRK